MEKTSWTDHVKNEEVLHKVDEERNILHAKKEEGRLTEVVGAAFQNMLLKERKKWREIEEEDVSSYWMTLRKRQIIGTWKRNHYIARSVENMF